MLLTYGDSLGHQGFCITAYPTKASALYTMVRESYNLHVNLAKEENVQV